MAKGEVELIKLVDKARANLIPIEVHLELTYNCNLRCKHCYITDYHSNDLDTGQWKLIIQELQEAGTLFLTFTGGEPFLREDIIELANYAKKLHFGFVFNTNGIYITPQIADAIKELAPYYVQVSIYGAVPEIHDQVTGVKGSFKKSINAIHYLRERRVPTSITTAVMKDNVHEVLRVKELATQLGASFYIGSRILPKRDQKPLGVQTSCNKICPESLQISDEDVISLAPDLFTAPEEDDLNSTITMGKKVIECGAGRNTCRISPEGDLYPCIIMPLKAGNVLKEGFSKLWYHSEVLNRLRKLANTPVPDCEGCELAKYCFRCLGTVVLEGRDFTDKSPQFCRKALAIKKFLAQRKQ
ncbi:MAG: radical SAM protein [bacterium]|nr:radical SAM protein [bacterium]